MQQGQKTAALLAAASRGETDRLQQLLAADAADGTAALYAAIKQGDSKLVNQLIDGGADVSGAVEARADRTPLHAAAAAGHTTPAVELLLAAGASKAAEEGWGSTPLHDAAAWGLAAAVRLLLGVGASTSAADARGRTPLHDAAGWVWGSELGRQEVVNVLLKSGADACATDAAGHTSPPLAAQQGRGSIVQSLLTASTHQTVHLATALEGAEGAEDADTADLLAAALATQQEAEKAAEGCTGGGSSSQGLPTQPPQHEHAPEESVTHQPQQQQLQEQQQDEDAVADVPGRRYSVAAVLRSIKAEPGTDCGDAAAAAAAASGPGQQAGPQALRLLQEAVAAGLMLPSEQQMDYFCLADQPFDGPQLRQLYTAHLAPHLATRSMGRTNRSGAVREAVVTLPLGHSRGQHVYPSLAPGFEQLTQQLSEAEQQLLRVQQQQLPGTKKRKLSSSNTAAILEAASDAARRLLLALRCLLCWEGRRLQEQGLPLLLHLLLFGGPAPAADGVVECVDLVSDEEEESLNRQLMQGDAELLIAREVQLREQQQDCDGAAAVGGGGSSSGGVRVKREPGVAC